ncbi:unnamed protein product [Knipowitschia caucasica]
MPFTRGKKPAASAATRLPKLRTDHYQEDAAQVKRTSSPPTGAPKKRTAFIDITNAHKVGLSFPGSKKDVTKKTVKKSSASVSSRNQQNLLKSSSVSSESEAEKTEARQEVVEVKQEVVEVKQEVVEVKQEVADVKEEVSDALVPVKQPQTDEAPPSVREVPVYLQRPEIPAEFDIDSENREDCVMSPEYAWNIFDYLKQREEKFVLPDYMNKQPSLNTEMRAILIDWLVEVQENFELFHETLYLAVKVTDHFLSQTHVHKEMLQLVGSTSMLIASKFEERSPPCLDDFLYICDDAYKREELIAMETHILQTLRFDINIPIAYRFLRRYAKCVNASMELLTLARFFCELSLLEMDLVVERGSVMASACLLLALLTKDLGGWTPCLQFHSGYSPSDLRPVVQKLHRALSAEPDDKLKAIRNKYSHKVFFEVAKTPVIDAETLEKWWKSENQEEPILS